MNPRTERSFFLETGSLRDEVSECKSIATCAPHQSQSRKDEVM